MCNSFIPSTVLVQFCFLIQKRACRSNVLVDLPSIFRLKNSKEIKCKMSLPFFMLFSMFFLTRMVIKELQNHVRLSCSYMGSVGVCCIVLNFSMKDHLWRQLRRSHTNIVAKFEHCFYHYPRFGCLSSFIFYSLTSSSLKWFYLFK